MTLAVIGQVESSVPVPHLSRNSVSLSFSFGYYSYPFDDPLADWRKAREGVLRAAASKSEVKPPASQRGKKQGRGEEAYAFTNQPMKAITRKKAVTKRPSIFKSRSATMSTSQYHIFLMLAEVQISASNANPARTDQKKRAVHQGAGFAVNY